ncbi:hypothetical protein M8C21_006021 [Ambrosia artemisiifolia]|uniref:Uncharacterized protein n=1 Tax=Ambrosia artemisiifolia TaxID=4212 RepID=A0AAD5C5F1_AMBAR|nr:hypothetical protein M8C21_006021 [Ambrosia artemisiifolia]
MTRMMKITCEEMVATYVYSDPHTRPDMLLEIIDNPKIMTLTIKPNRTIAVNVVADTKPDELPPANAPTPAALPPITPAKRAYNTNRDGQGANLLKNAASDNAPTKATNAYDRRIL